MPTALVTLHHKDIVTATDFHPADDVLLTSSLDGLW